MNTVTAGQSRKHFIWVTVGAKTTLPTLALIALIRTWQHGTGDFRDDLVRFLARVFFASAIVAPIIYLAAGRFWDRGNR